MTAPKPPADQTQTQTRATPHMSHKPQAGFSMVEVLVTLVLVSLGLLGVAGMLVKGISNIAATESNAKASQLAADMSDRIRANPVVALNTISNDYLLAFDDVPQDSPSSTAQLDKSVWLKALARALPQGDGQILRSSLNPRGLVLSIRWSNCAGTLGDAELSQCKLSPATAFKTLSYELR